MLPKLRLDRIVTRGEHRLPDDHFLSFAELGACVGMTGADAFEHLLKHHPDAVREINGAQGR